MKRTLTALAVLTASPAFAHSGAHLHPHATDPSWLPLMIASFVIAGAASLATVRRK